MRKSPLISLMFALLTSASLNATAAPAPQGQMAAPATMQMQTQAPSAMQMTVPGKVNLNAADAETLKRELAGVGLAKAEAIVKHREAHGAFASVDELLEVNGIGKALLDKNRDKLVVN